MARPLNLHLDLGTDPYKLVEINPVVVFSVLDHYIRREEGQERVIGTLLGNIEEGVIQVTNCFAVPLTEKDQVAVNMDFHRTMMKLHLEVAAHEQIVGWYATGMNNSSILIHENFYGREMNFPPIHLLVDPSLNKGNFGVNCYYGLPIQLGERGRLQEQFRPLRHVMKTFQVERTTLEHIIQDKDIPIAKRPPISDLDSLERCVKALIEMLETIAAYIKTVLNGEKQGDTKIGRLIEETMAILPSTDSGQFDKMFTKGLQDVLMVVYLANLTQTHLLLAEKLRDQTPKNEET